MILSDTAILAAVKAGEIVIDSFDLSSLGGNSYDVHLGPVLRVYESLPLQLPGAENYMHMSGVLDAAHEHHVRDLPIPGGGIVLMPGVLYLASTAEYTETHKHVPYLDGKSSIGRLGIFIHTTAGRGDVGFAGHWTMEISVVQPVRVYAGMPIGQLTYHTVEGDVERRYQTKAGASYVDGRDPMPQPSRLWKKLQAKR